MLMGSADVIPGVSGGTVALLVGIYEELIDGISALTRPMLWRAIWQRHWQRAIALIPWRFLGTLGLGIGLAIVVLARVLEQLLEHYPVAIWSVFFGLIAASVVTVRKRVSRWHPPTYAMFALGTVIAFGLVGLTPAATPTGLWFLFLSGFIAVCALILPGISGAFILVLLGKYQLILAAVNQFDFAVIATVGLGAVSGLLSVARVLRWTLARYHDVTIALLCGFMLGSLRKVWPWQQLREDVLVNVLPTSLGEAVGAFGLAAFAFVVVVGLESWSAKRAARA
jgi:putative membrane protein